jgi:formylglycine-generating enzyme required for sulfatase activity
VKVLRGPGHYPVGPVEAFMLNDMIVKPARCAGLRITDQLASRIVEDTGTKEGNLPLLGFVLEKLFEKRVDHDLSEDMYKRLKGVAGAIGTHVKTVEAKIEQAVATKADRLLPDIFQTLARVQKEEGPPTRNRPLLKDFTAHRRKVVDVLVSERLLRTEGEGEAATVSLSHEQLFEAWPALKLYVDTHKKGLVDRTLLESRARKWVEMGRPWFSGLASGREHNDFRRAGGTATTVMTDYLAASRLAGGVKWGAFVLVTLLIGVPIVWLEIENVTIKYARSIILARLHLVSVVEPVMKNISGGSYSQGDLRNSGSSDEKPVHEVTIKPFAIGQYEVTFEEYDHFLESTTGVVPVKCSEPQPDARCSKVPKDEEWGRVRRPVINVSWEDAKAYAKWLSQATGKRYRLPTESEWEYAARSLGQDEIWAGTSIESQLKDYAVYDASSTAPVGGKKQNGLDLYDLSGNVWEWVEDCWHGNYKDAPADGSAWREAGSGDCGRRVLRGGSWNCTPVGLRVSSRSGAMPTAGTSTSVSVSSRTFRSPVPFALWPFVSGSAGLMSPRMVLEMNDASQRTPGGAIVP